MLKYFFKIVDFQEESSKINFLKTAVCFKSWNTTQVSR